jgi:two-component system, cell cycle sensor histidine kinase and response regulator CckA
MRQASRSGRPPGAQPPGRSLPARKEDGLARPRRPAAEPVADLAGVRRLLRSLEKGLAGVPVVPEMLATVHDLQLAMEEVELADEELKLQNEELLSVRGELELQRVRYQDLFDLAPDGYLVTDLAGVVQEANRAALALFHVSRKAMRGKPLVIFVAYGERERFRALLHRLKEGERLADWEVSLQRRHGRERETFPSVVTVVRETGLDREPELRWILRDVTARRATEQALRESEDRLRHGQRLESIGRLAGGIAHSFNNLMGAIAFHVDLLDAGLDLPVKGDGDAGRLRAHLAAIEQAVERAGRLASQLLAFGRKQILKPRRLSINAMLAEMTAMLQQLVGERVQLETRLDSEAGEVEVDLAQLEQVILNLVVNARDAMPDGGTCRIETSAVTLPDEGSPLGLGDLEAGPYVRIAVVDTGAGMSEEVKAHLFEPFYTTKEHGKGTGLGLATVYGIVRQSGGRVRVESAEGEGTRFEIFLPRAPQESQQPLGAPPRSPHPPRSPRPASRGHEVVLLVEDEENIREPAAEVLAGQGYRVLPARSAEEALEVAAREGGPIHLTVTDVVMPGLSGGDLAVRLAAARPEMKVLFISGYPEDAISPHGVLDPGKSFLQKPFHPATFLRTVRRLLDGMPLGDET